MIAGLLGFLFDFVVTPPSQPIHIIFEHSPSAMNPAFVGMHPPGGPGAGQPQAGQPQAGVFNNQLQMQGQGQAQLQPMQQYTNPATASFSHRGYHGAPAPQAAPPPPQVANTGSPFPTFEGQRTTNSASDEDQPKKKITRRPHFNY